MFKKFNQTKLLFVFFILLAIVVIIYFIDSKNGERTFNRDIINVDISKVTSISISPKGKKLPEIIIFRDNNVWKLKSKEQIFDADTSAISNILKSVSSIKAERVVSNDKEGWKEYQVSDSATRVKIEVENKIVADFYVGKFSYQQKQSQNMQQGGDFSLTTYIRPVDDDNVYAIDGFLSILFNRGIADYRNRVIINNSMNLWNSISFNYPSDSSFILKKSVNQWTINNQPVDSIEIQNYLNSINGLECSEFVEEKVAVKSPLYSIKINVLNKPAIELKAEPSDSAKKFIISSSANPNATFYSPNKIIINKIFVGKSKFFKKQKYK